MLHNFNINELSEVSVKLNKYIPFFKPLQSIQLPTLTVPSRILLPKTKKKGFIPKLTVFKNGIMWAFPKGRVFRFNLFCGKKDHKKGFALQSLNQNNAINRTKQKNPITSNYRDEFSVTVKCKNEQ